jgi:hypothetical protein
MTPGPNAGDVAFSVLFHDFTPFSFRSVSAQEVAEAVFSIKSEAIALDNVSFKFVKLLAPSLIPHITIFFNFCFTHDIFPVDWKVSKIIPLLNISNPSDFSDNRPSAILLYLSKAFEVCKRSQMVEYLMLNKILIA